MLFGFGIEYPSASTSGSFDVFADPSVSELGGSLVGSGGGMPRLVGVVEPKSGKPVFHAGLSSLLQLLVVLRVSS